MAGPALPPITDHLPHDSHSHTVQRLLKKKNCFLRDINQKIFPILTVTNMSDNQWSQFVKKDSGFAFLAYWNDMLVKDYFTLFNDEIVIYKDEST